MFLYYQVLDRAGESGEPTTDRYWYYKSTSKLGAWNRPGVQYTSDADIWIDTDQFRFDYRIKGDTLIEIEKMGDQVRFVKVINDNK